MTRQELIDQAMLTAEAGLGSENFALRDDPAVAEVLIPQAVRKLSLQMASMPDSAYLLRRTISVPFTNGIADVPVEALPELFDSAELRVPPDSASGLASPVVQWVQNYSEFTGWQQGGYWYALARDGRIELRDSAGPLQDAGELLLDCATELGDATLANFPVQQESDLIAMLAKMLRDFNHV